jgi:hypothetical protein
VKFIFQWSKKGHKKGNLNRPRSESYLQSTLDGGKIEPYTKIIMNAGKD